MHQIRLTSASTRWTLLLSVNRWPNSLLHLNPNQEHQPLHQHQPNAKDNGTTRFCNNTDCCWKHGFYIGLKHTSVTIKNPNPVRTPKGCHTHKPNEWWHSQLLLDSKWWHWGKENNSGAFEDPISITHYHSAFSPSGQINALLANSPFHALSNDETMVADKGCTTSLVNTITPLLNKKPTSNGISMSTASNCIITSTSKGNLPISQLSPTCSHLPNSKCQRHQAKKNWLQPQKTSSVRNS